MGNCFINHRVPLELIFWPIKLVRICLLIIKKHSENFISYQGVKLLSASKNLPMTSHECSIYLMIKFNFSFNYFGQAQQSFGKICMDK